MASRCRGAARPHGAYANALAGMRAGLLPAPQFTAELAAHWYRAGQPAEALTWSVRAADRAERVYAHGEAARRCERVLELWDQVPDAAGRAGTGRAGLHTRAARAWEYAGDEARAPSHVEQAVRQVDPAADPVRAGLLHNLRGWQEMALWVTGFPGSGRARQGKARQGPARPRQGPCE